MKKKLIVHTSGKRKTVNTMLLKMKLLTALIFAGTMALSASTYSQRTKLDLRLQNSSVSEILSSIEKNSEFIFIYNANLLKTGVKKSISVKGENIEKVLDLLFNDTDVSYRIDDRQIFLYKKEELKKPETPDEQINGELPADQPQKKQLKGKVTNQNGEGIPGTTVLVKGTQVGTITDFDGNFVLDVPLDSKVLSFSFIGMKSLELPIGDNTTFNVTLEEQSVGLEEVVAVGYGTQKKASVVGAISAITSKELQRSGGVNNLAMSLTGKLSGVTTIQTTGQPGKDDPKIYIRGQGTWNGGQPYVLVDGVERKMNDIDMSEVDNISVLKDASATAVYGVKGANGVILITTKRGSKTKPQLSLSANSTLRWPAGLMPKLDSYDMFMVKNDAIEREVPLSEAMWADYTPREVVRRYRNQQSLKYPEAYPNVDWQKEMVKPYTMDHRVNMNVAGGTDFAKYFSSLAYSTQGDLMKAPDNGRGYTPGFGYNKFNFRTNLDLNLTKTTSLKFNLAGVYAELKSSRANINISNIISGQYALPPNAYLPQYADGRWGLSTNTDSRMINSAAVLANQGYDQTRMTDLTTDIGINQKLDFITQGLSASASASFDNHFEAIKSLAEWGSWPTKYINPAIEDMPAGGDPNSYIIIGPVAGTNQFSWIYRPWLLQDENADNSISTLRRRLYYQAQLSYARGFGKHDVTATGVFTREQWATGSEFQRYREDWVARATYNYDNRYFAEFNGAYNGSEKFGADYRFAFFPSGAVGWTISNEQFMKSTENWLNKLRLRYSFGKIGDDGGLSQRWMYATQWEYGGLNGGRMPFNQYGATNQDMRSPYVIYNEKAVGNPDIQWETALKLNWGLEVAVFNNMLTGNFEYFTEDRTNIMLAGSSRILPDYFGTLPPPANVGRVTKKGYEIELRFNKNLNYWHLWAETFVTHVVDKVMEREEPALKDPHLLAKGFQIDQTRTTISTGFIQTWDEIYGTTPFVSSDGQRLPGNYSIIDFDGDGIIDGAKDRAPYGYSNRPQNNYNLTLGADYKGWSAMVQFYGVSNVTRWVSFENFASNIDILYAQTLDHWSKENPDASYILPRWKTGGGQNNAQIFHYDGSYLRLKTAEIAYTFTGAGLKRVGMSGLKLYLNGNNLLFWSKMPDDREQQNQGPDGDRFGAYPTSKRINFGVDIKF
jgi:TonB-linked SusC/RagA family outer membrane protein